MKRILVTGAGPKSFIGCSIKEGLREKHTVFAPFHAELDGFCAHHHAAGHRCRYHYYQERQIEIDRDVLVASR